MNRTVFAGGFKEGDPVHLKTGGEYGYVSITATQIATENSEFPWQEPDFKDYVPVVIYDKWGRINQNRTGGYSIDEVELVSLSVLPTRLPPQWDFADVVEQRFRVNLENRYWLRFTINVLIRQGGRDG